MKKLKVVTIVGTRPEIIRLSRLIPRLDEHTDHTLVYTNQNFDPNLSDVFFQGLQIRDPDFVLPAQQSGSLGGFLGGLFTNLQDILLEKRPDAVVILGDTNSGLGAIAAEKLSIPVFHLEAGNRSFDARVPEELNRRVIDHASSYNLAYTENARRNLLREGLHPNTVTVTGSPMAEVLDFYSQQIERSAILKSLQVEQGKFFVLSTHRQETVDNPELLGHLIDAVENIAEGRGLSCIVSTHPRTLERLRARGYNPPRQVVLSQPMPFFDYVKLQQSASFVLSDSGTLSEESSILGFPAVTIRDSMERQEAVESAVLTSSGVMEWDIENGINLALSLARPRSHPEYESRDFSIRVISFLLSKLRAK